MRERTGVLFPVLAVEGFDGQSGDRARVQAADIDVDAVGIRARNIETLDPAHFAETMLGDAGVEGVLGQIVMAGDQPKPRRRHDQMPEAAHPAQRAIAFLHGEHRRRVDLENNAAAMTAAAMGDQRGNVRVQ